MIFDDQPLQFDANTPLEGRITALEDHITAAMHNDFSLFERFPAVIIRETNAIFDNPYPEMIAARFIGIYHQILAGTVGIPQVWVGNVSSTIVKKSEIQDLYIDKKPIYLDALHLVQLYLEQNNCRVQSDFLGKVRLALLSKMKPEILFQGIGEVMLTDHETKEKSLIGMTTDVAKHERQQERDNDHNIHDVEKQIQKIEVKILSYKDPTPDQDGVPRYISELPLRLFTRYHAALTGKVSIVSVATELSRIYQQFFSGLAGEASQNLGFFTNKVSTALNHPSDNARAAVIDAIDLLSLYLRRHSFITHAQIMTRASDDLKDHLDPKSKLSSLMNDAYIKKHRPSESLEETVLYNKLGNLQEFAQNNGLARTMIARIESMPSPMEALQYVVAANIVARRGTRYKRHKGVFLLSSYVHDVALNNAQIRPQIAERLGVQKVECKLYNETRIKATKKKSGIEEQHGILQVHAKLMDYLYELVGKNAPINEMGEKFYSERMLQSAKMVKDENARTLERYISR